MSKHFYLRLVACSLLSLAWLSSGYAQQLQLNGVLETEQGDSIPGAWVFVSYSSDEFQVCRTDASGAFEFKGPVGLKKPKDRTPTVSAFVMGNAEPQTKIERTERGRFKQAWGERRFAFRKGKKCESVKWSEENHWVLKATLPEVVTHELKLQKPDGEPLKNQTVRLFPYGARGVREYQLRLTMQTDNEGRLKIRQIPSHVGFEISVPQVGFGSTGILIFHADQTDDPIEVPRLAAYGTVKVSVPGAIDGRVWIASFGYEHLGLPVGTRNADGSYTLWDVLPGKQTIRFSGEPKFEEVSVIVQPGEELQCTLSPPKPLPPPLPLAGKVKAVEFPQQFRSKPIGRVRSGRLVDAAGEPIPQCPVYLQEKWFGGLRMNGKSRVMLTDQDGEFSFPAMKQTSSSPSVHGVLIAKATGYPPVIMKANDSEHLLHHSPDPLTEKKYQLQTSPVGGTLNVKVLLDGKPAEGFSVRLFSQDFREQFDNRWARMYSDSDSGWQKIVHPIAVTNAQGVASFVELFPGNYSLRAQAKAPKSLGYYESGEMGSDDGTAIGWMKSVSVAASKTSNVSVAVRAYPRTRRLRVLDPSGKPVRNRHVAGVPTDDDGVVQWKQEVNGLRTFQLKFGRLPNVDASHAIYQISSAVGVSALLPSWLVELRARKQNAPTLKVEVLNLAGEPMPGATVVANRSEGRNSHVSPCRFSSTTDSQGTIKWKGLEPWPVTLITGTSKPTVETNWDTPDEQLVKQTFVPSRTVKPETNQDTKIQLREKLGGWVRGSVVLPKGVVVPEGVPNSWFRASATGDAQVDFDSRSGEYLLGPIFEKQVVPTFTYDVNAKREIYISTKPIEVTLGKVTKAKIELKRCDSPEPGGTCFSGSITEADGKTPVYGARLFALVPDSKLLANREFVSERLQEAARGVSHADGKFEFALANRFLFLPDSLPITPTTQPLLVAHVPGRIGGVSIPLSKNSTALSIKLPPAVSLSGVVTVNGQSTSDLPSHVRIMARPVDGGPVADLLEVETSASSDGTFTLAGLSPGKHKIQASVDDVWFSTARDFDVGNDPIPNSFDIDIAELGLPVRLQLTDPAGVALPGLSVEVSSLQGPLLSSVRKEPWQSDSGGFVHLDGLPAGKIELQVGPNQTPHQVQVPAWSKDPNPLEVQVLKIDKVK